MKKGVKMKSEIIKSRENPIIKHFAKLQKDRSYRESSSEYVVEGVKLLQEAIRSNVQICTVFYLESLKNQIDFEFLEKKENVRLLNIDEKMMERISDVKTPQGIVFSCRMPDTLLSSQMPDKNVIVLDGISDPGNLGTIIRTADAFSLNGVILTGDCTDLFSPKTVRSAMGSLFRVHVFRSDSVQLGEKFRISKVPVYSAVLSDEAENITELMLKDSAVVIGSEAHGVSDEMQAISTGFVKIPMSGQTESLNAAVSAAIIMWEMTTRR
ncbi:MAG: RNA methyltransferase [Clostridiales bacterium]|nr:RNA methyltransferase [Clostridiales bacterium]